LVPLPSRSLGTRGKMKIFNGGHGGPPHRERVLCWVGRTSLAASNFSLWKENFHKKPVVRENAFPDTPYPGADLSCPSFPT